MTKKHPVHNPRPVDHVSFGTRIGWGFGGVADNYIMNAFSLLGLLLYVDFFKMHPALAGVAMFIPRFFDAITDPIVGNISDNTRSRWGRRRPYMAWGAVLSAVILPLLWMPPAASTAGNVWYANMPFIWLTLIGSLYTLVYTLFVVPYTALGYELTNDYDERTRVLAWRMYLGLGAGLLLPWLYRFCTMNIFPNEVVGARWVCSGVGIIILVTGLIPVFACKEREDVEKQETIGIIPALKYTITNRPFLILLIAYLIIITGLFSAGNIGSFIGIFYICQGDKAFAGKLGGLAGTLNMLAAYASMFLATSISVRFSKRAAMIAGLMFALIGGIISWWTMDPRWPYAQLIVAVITGLGYQGCWLMISSMIADVCDEDELKTGLRREGMFGAVAGFSQKTALAITQLGGGLLLVVAGFDSNVANTEGMPLETALMMKGLYVGFTVAALIIAIVIFCFYPISRSRAEETRRQLDERKRQQNAATPEVTV